MMMNTDGGATVTATAPSSEPLTGHDRSLHRNVRSQARTPSLHLCRRSAARKWNWSSMCTVGGQFARDGHLLEKCPLIVEPRRPVPAAAAATRPLTVSLSRSPRRDRVMPGAPLPGPRARYLEILEEGDPNWTMPVSSGMDGPRHDRELDHNRPVLVAPGAIERLDHDVPSPARSPKRSPVTSR